jgi:hypothetical protein
MSKTTLLAVAALLAAGCASKTGIVPIGDGIYMSSMQDYSLNYHGGKVKAELYREAGEFCAKQGKRSVPVDDTSRDAAAFTNYASAEVKFRCQ